MIHPASPSPTKSANGLPESGYDPHLVKAMEDYLGRLESGETVRPKEFVRDYPEIGPELERCLASLQFLENVSPALEAQTPTPAAPPNVEFPDDQLGDFHLLREIGRGGMGVVYEAEPIFLARRAAVKVLPFASLLDARQLQRFKNEARAAATLDHPHIVSVYAIGLAPWTPTPR